MAETVIHIKTIGQSLGNGSIKEITKREQVDPDEVSLPDGLSMRETHPIYGDRGASVPVRNTLNLKTG